MTISLNNSETGTKVQNPIMVKSCPQSDTTVERLPPQRIPSAEPDL